MLQDFFKTFLLLCVSLIGLNISYIVLISVELDQNQAACITFGVFTHFYLLSSFNTMLSLGILQYMVYNQVFNQFQNYFKISLIFILGKILNYLKAILAGMNCIYTLLYLYSMYIPIHLSHTSTLL